MNQYRNKPVIIKAVRWYKNIGDNDYGSMNSEGNINIKPLNINNTRYQFCRFCGGSSDVHGWIRTFKEPRLVCPGDWIIIDAEGEISACKPDIFDAIYERLEK